MSYTWKPPIRHRRSTRITPCRRCKALGCESDLEVNPANNLSRRDWVCHICANQIRAMENRPLWDYAADTWQTKPRVHPDQLFIWQER